MSRMTGTTAVTAGLGTLVLLNAVLGWGMQRPQARQDIPGPSAAALDPAVALQLRSGAWRHWPAQDPAGAVSPASSPRQPLSATLAAQPNVPVASLAERPPALDHTIPVEQLTRSLPPPPPQEGAEAASPSAAAPSAPLPTVSMPPPSKDRMQLAGPPAEPTALIEQEGSRERQPAAQSALPQTELPGNAGALPTSKFGPDSFRRFERNGF